VFIDAEPNHWQMDTQRVVDFLDQDCKWHNGELRNSTTGRQIKAILPVHILGHPVDMRPILEVARKYGLIVIEDATESLGARYRGGLVGHLGDIACLSFNGNKIITTGGGGMIVTDNEAWARQAKYLTTQAKDDPVEYVHHRIGYNYRLTNIQAAMGCAQMEKLDEYVAAKRRIAARYTEAAQRIAGITPMCEASWAYSAYWMYTVRINEAGYPLNSRALMRHFASAHIQARPLWQPLHQSPAYTGAQVVGGMVAERINDEALSLPCSVGLAEEEQNAIIGILDEIALGHHAPLGAKTRQESSRP
jgi:perosamine synthetase